MNHDRKMSPWSLILLGFLLSASGVVFPFLMVIQVIPSTFFLNFFSFGASFIGMILGVVGISYYLRDHRR
jgi:hypothetical protein